MRPALVLLFATGALAGLAARASAGSVFRFNDMDLRDPHVFMNFLGCRDVTDTQLAGFSVNGSIQTAMTTDSEPDGNLDLSYLLAFDPLDPSAPSGTLKFQKGTCTSPVGTTSCQPETPGDETVLAFTNSSSGTCLGLLPGTVHPYTPGVTASTSPCFATDEGAFMLDLELGVEIPLTHARIGGTYVGGPPPTSITNGLIRGFLREDDANGIILPASFPVVGGQPLSILFAGGSGSCPAYSDKDVVDGHQGWWLYVRFVASPVPFQDPLAVVDPAEVSRRLEAFPNPHQGSVSLRYQTAREGFVRVSVHDVQGRRIAELVSVTRGPGAHTVVWDGRSGSGAPVRPGVQLVRFESDEGVLVQPIVQLR